MDSLRIYPQVNALFAKVAAAAPQARIKRAQIREDELLKLVKEAVHQLETSGLPVTKEAVGKIVRLSRDGFRCYSRILAFWEEVIDQRAQALEEQARLREEELLQQVRAAIKSLESCGKPVTLRAIQAMVGMSIVALKAYPQIDQLLTAVVQAGQHARKQVTEANSTEG